MRRPLSPVVRRLTPSAPVSDEMQCGRLERVPDDGHIQPSDGVPLKPLARNIYHGAVLARISRQFVDRVPGGAVTGGAAGGGDQLQVAVAQCRRVGSGIDVKQHLVAFRLGVVGKHVPLVNTIEVVWTRKGTMPIS